MQVCLCILPCVRDDYVLISLFSYCCYFFDSPDLDKNKHAVAVIYYLIANCCWLNVHVVQPHGAVFEIRVADGYGARWSNNGTKVYLSYKNVCIFFFERKKIMFCIYVRRNFLSKMY